jgi:hypothetical protein
VKEKENERKINEEERTEANMAQQSSSRELL